MSLAVIGGNIVGEFLVHGLVDEGLPQKGSVHEDAMKEISRSHLTLIYSIGWSHWLNS